MKKAYLIAIAILLVASVAYIIPGIQSEQTGAFLKYNSMVCVYKNNEMVSCKHNIVTNAGLNHIKDFLGAGTADSAASNGIALGNGSSPVAGSTTLSSEITDCGLARAAGSYASVGTGNWTITKLWTSSCAVGVVNSTGLFNLTAGTGGTMFAGNTFTNVALQANDQLNVTWTIWVTSS